MIISCANLGIESLISPKKNITLKSFSEISDYL